MFNADSKLYLNDLIVNHSLSDEERLDRKINAFYHDDFDFLTHNFKANIYDDHIELIKYKDELRSPNILNKNDKDLLLYQEGLILPEKDSVPINRDRLFKLVDKDLVLNRDDVSNFEALKRSKSNILKSRIRTLNSLYSFALSNNWNYWVTLTFDRSKFDSSDSSVISSQYNLFSKAVKQLDSKANMLFVMEYHSDNEHIHLHGFIHSSINCLDSSLTQAINPNTNEFIKDCNGNYVYNSSIWSCGYNTVVKIPFNANKFRIANYLTKYIGKNIEMPYGTKMLLHSRGLKSRYEYLATITDDELLGLISEYYWEIGHPEYFNRDYTKLSIFKKETDKFIVFNLTYNTEQVP